MGNRHNKIRRKSKFKFQVESKDEILDEIQNWNLRLKPKYKI